MKTIDKPSDASKNVSELLEEIVQRANEVDWQKVSNSLDAEGNAMIEGLLFPGECRQISEFYSRDDIFRSRVVMGRHGFGKGEYKYFSYPLPDIVQAIESCCLSASCADRKSLERGYEYPSLVS